MPAVHVPKVLVVDDDKSFAFELAGSLKKSGYSVTQAEHVSDAYAMIEQGDFDVAVVDLNLPDKSGLELIHKAKHCGKPVKILATTAVFSDLHLEIATYMGADIALRKFNSEGDEFPSDEWVKAINVTLQTESNSTRAETD